MCKNNLKNCVDDNKKERIESIVNSILEENVSKSDPDGHYTGCPKGKKNKMPIQDPDDL